MTGVRVPATSANLGPGFDSFGVALDLYLTARLVERDGAGRVRTTGEGSAELPGDDSNLVWRSFVAGCERFAVEMPDVAIEVTNDIPLERGLGSSSAAIVAGVGLARQLSPVPIGDLAVAALADELEGHPDNVVPALTGGLTVCARDDGGALVIRRVNPSPALHPVVFVPTERQSTEAARAVMPDSVTTSDAAEQAARAGHVLGALAGIWPVDARLAGDRLHEPSRLGVMRTSSAVLGDLRQAGLHAWLSGAGPTVTAAVAQEHVERCDEVAAAHGMSAARHRWDLGGAVLVD